VPFAVGASVSQRLEALARAHGATPFMVLLAASAALLHRLSGAVDMILGSVSANRDVPGLAGVVGCCVNPLPLRLSVQPRQSFAALLQSVRSVALEALEHGAYPFDLLVRQMRASGEPGRAPLFDIGLSWNALEHMQRRQFAGCDLAPFGEVPAVAKYDLLIIAGAGETGIGGVIEYAADLFDAPAVAALAGQLCAILEQVGSGADVAVTDLALGRGAPAPRAPLAIELQL
jgi:non-ribosomal peptide synthetase component F